MNNRSFTISLVIALLAVLMVHSYVTSTEESYRKDFKEETTVVVAGKNIGELDPLDETNLTVQTMPKKFIQPGTSGRIGDFVGGLAIAPVSKGEQITRTKVTFLGVRTGLSRQISLGKRAVTVRVNDSRGVSRLIKPGDRVDVLAVIDYGKGNIDFIEVKTILQDVLVLATGKLIANTVPGIIEQASSDTRKNKTVNLTRYTTFNSVTLEATPVNAQKLVLTESKLGGVYLILRHNDDNGENIVKTTSVSDVLGPNSKRNVSSGGGRR